MATWDNSIGTFDSGGGDTILEVSAIEVLVADDEYKAVVNDDIITIIIEDD